MVSCYGNGLKLILGEYTRFLSKGSFLHVTNGVFMLYYIRTMESYKMDLSNIKLSASDIIQLIGILVALMIGIISIIISIVAIRQNSKIIKESNKAQIEVFPFKIYGDVFPRIKIQNFGKTTGTITSVITNPEIPTDDILDNPFKYYEGLSLAPNQSFSTIFSKESEPEVPIKEFEVTLTYMTLDEKVVSKHRINYNFLDGYYEAHTSSTETNKALDKINRSIQGLQQR